MRRPSFAWKTRIYPIAAPLLRSVAPVVPAENSLAQLDLSCAGMKPGESNRSTLRPLERNAGGGS